MSGMPGMSGMAPRSAVPAEVAEPSAKPVPPPDAGNDIPPDAPTDFVADGYYAKADMDAARATLQREHGGATVSKFMLDELEYTRRRGDDGYRWKGQAWFGGDINRFIVKTEGDGAKRLEDAEVQALYSRAIGPYTNLQAGLRHDFEPNPSRTYLALSVDALAPYWFELEGAAFVGERGDVLARAEGSYDLLLTQRLALQPRAEMNFSTKSDAVRGRGDGLTDADIGLRLRYEIRREFAPYVGVSWQRRFGGTADFARAAGEGDESTNFVLGLRAWY
jgi:copper resistance protein B